MKKNTSKKKKPPNYLKVILPFFSNCFSLTQFPSFLLELGCDYFEVSSLQEKGMKELILCAISLQLKNENLDSTTPKKEGGCFIF